MITISKNDFLLLFSYFVLTTMVYVFPFLNLPLGFDTSWMFLIFSNDNNLALPYYYESAGIVPGNIFESVKSLSLFYGRASFLNLSQFWILAKISPEISFIWRLIPVLSMSVSVFLWHKIFIRFNLPHVFLFILIYFLILDPASIWTDWNKAESTGFLFYSIACYYSLSKINTHYYLAVFSFILALFFKETFLIGASLIMLFRMYSSNEIKSYSFKNYILKFIANNKLFFIMNLNYLLFIFIYFLSIDLSNSYLLNLVVNRPDFLLFFIDYIKLQFPLYFSNLYFIYFPILIFSLLFLIVDILIISKNDSNRNFKIMLLIFYTFTFVIYFFVIYEFGLIQRRYAVPINMLNIMFFIFMFKFYKHAIKINQSIIISTIATIPCLYWLYNFNLILSALALFTLLSIFFLVKFFNFSNLRFKLLKLVTVLFIIVPITDVLFVNLVANRSELIQWKEINTFIYDKIDPGSTLIANLSENFIIEHVITLETEAIISGRNDIVFLVDVNTLPESIKGNQFQLNEIERFNTDKKLNFEQYYVIEKIDLQSQNSPKLIENIKNRYRTSTYTSKYNIKFITK